MTGLNQQTDLPIYVAGDQKETGLFQICANTSERPLGDIQAYDLEGFFVAAATAVHEIFPESKVVVLATTLDGDVKQVTYDALQPAAA